MWKGRSRPQFLDCLKEYLKIMGLGVTDTDDRQLWREENDFAPVTLSNQEKPVVDEEEKEESSSRVHIAKAVPHIPSTIADDANSCLREKHMMHVNRA